MAKRKLRIIWTCSDYCHHEHRWKATAWACGWLQYLATYVVFWFSHYRVTYSKHFIPKERNNSWQV